MIILRSLLFKFLNLVFSARLTSPSDIAVTRRSTSVAVFTYFPHKKPSASTPVSTSSLHMHAMFSLNGISSGKVALAELRIKIISSTSLFESDVFDAQRLLKISFKLSNEPASSTLTFAVLKRGTLSSFFS